MSTVHANQVAGVRVLTLDRPPANAIHTPLLEDLSSALDEAKADGSTRALVLTGAGRFFSAGLDLAAGAGQTPDEAAVAFERFRDTMLALLTAPMPTVAAVNGHAIAGGLIFALACDLRLFAEGDLRIGLNEVAIGATYPMVAFEIVRLRLDHAAASELLLEAQLYPVSEARRLGISETFCPPEEIEDAAVAVAAKLGAYPREAYAHTKAALLRETVERVLSESPEEAARSQAIWRSDESRAAMAAQLARLGKR